jgi:hypothetical protein
MAKTRVALIAFALLIGSLSACSTPQEKIVNSERFAKAKAMFDERCKTAGEKIHRTVDNVDGIYLLKIRTTTNHGHQFRLDDPYGHDSTNDEYLKNFLKGYYYQRASSTPPSGSPRAGYSYIEAVDTKDGRRFRYGFVMERVLATDKPPRYGVTFDDISTREDREYWIAGSSLKVIRLRGQVLQSNILLRFRTARLTVA